MSRIASLHDLSIYNSYKNNKLSPPSNKKTSISSDRQLKSDNVDLTISESGKNALQNLTQSSKPLSPLTEEVHKRDKEISATLSDYKSRFATQQYQKISKLSFPGATIDSEL